MDHGCVTILSNEKVTQLEMLSSPHALASVCHSGPILSAPPEGNTLQKFGPGCWAVLCTNPLLASQTKWVLLSPLPGRDDLFIPALFTS